MYFDLVRIGGEPLLPGFVEPVARPIVDNKEDLARRVGVYQALRELVERVAVEDVRELVGEAGLIQANGAEYMGRLPQAEGIYSRLDADFGPGLVESPVEPEAGLVFEYDDAAGLCRFFFISGSRSLSQAA